MSTEPTTQPDAAPQPPPPSAAPIERGLFLAHEENGGDGRWHLSSPPDAETSYEGCACGVKREARALYDIRDPQFGFTAPELFCDKAREALTRPGGAQPSDAGAVKAASSTSGQTQALAKQAERAAVPFQPRDTQEMFRYAQFLAGSELIPKALQRRPSDVLVVLLKGQDLGLTPMQSISGINVIDGKAEVGALMMVSMIRKSGLCEYWRLVHSDDKRAVYETQRRGDPSPTTFEYTIEEAREAGLLDKGKDEWARKKQPWNTQRRTMLRRRCQSHLAREVYPDIVAGLYDHDELQEVRELERELIRTSMAATRAGIAVVSDADVEPAWMASGAREAASTDGTAGETIIVKPIDPPATTTTAPTAPAKPADPMKDRLRKRAEDAKAAAPKEPDEMPCTRCGVPIDPPKNGAPQMCYACKSETES